MSHPWHHALSSARRHGGRPEDYLSLHQWFGLSKEHLADFRHRALRHHSQGIYEAERTFGPTITNSDGKRVPTRILAEQHVREDLGRIPTLADWLRRIKGEPWMFRGVLGRPPQQIHDSGDRGADPVTLQLWFVDCTTEDGDSLDMFAAAAAPEQAFDLWRAFFGITPEDHAVEDRQVTVYPLPALGDAPGVRQWPHAAASVFLLSDNLRAMQAPLAELTANGGSRQHGDRP